MKLKFTRKGQNNILMQDVLLKWGGGLATLVHIVLSLRNSFCNSVVIDTYFTVKHRLQQ